jgi:methyl-accepting chemotaxis protein
MNAAIFIGAGLFLTYLASRNLTLPFAEIIETLQGVRNGKFDKKIRVTSNDEIDTFCHPLVNEDDVTLVVVKVDA